MPTTQEEKPAKPRSRSRKADQKAAKAEAKVQAAPEQASVAAEPVSTMIAAAIEAAAAEVPEPETAPAATVQADVAPDCVAPKDVKPSDAVPVAAMMEKAPDAALSGEVLPPEVRKAALQTTSLAAIALAHGDYTRKSWLAGRSLVERLIAVRSLEEAIEVQGEFAKQACENFIAHSQKICGLYSEWTRQFFRPYEKFAAEWTHVAR